MPNVSWKKNLHLFLQKQVLNQLQIWNKEQRNFINLPYEPIKLTKDINKVIMVHSKSFFEKNLDKLKEALKDYDVLLIGPQWLEIMPKNVNKASAIKKITKKRARRRFPA